MKAIRHENDNTSRNARDLINIIKDENTERVVLFATPGVEEDTNCPLVAAVAEYEIPGAQKVKVIYDGLFLTAKRRPRYDEVRDVLDNAESSGKVFFAQERAPFTSKMNTDEAAAALESVGGLLPLTPDTRAKYFSLLCSVPEVKYP